MKIILHIGMPKSGTTALQTSLTKASTALKEGGVLYPSGAELPRDHNMMVCGVLPYDDLPRLFRQVYVNRREKIGEDVAFFYDKIRDAASKAKCKLLILSSEMLFQNFGNDRLSRLADDLASMSADIEVIAYVRRPSDYYISIVQQVIKASSRILPPAPVLYREIIESYKEVFKKIHVVAYDRAALHGGDITLDFLTRVAPEALGFLPKGRKGRANESLSAEGMDVLHFYRKNALPGSNGKFTSDTASIIAAIRDVERKQGNLTKPILFKDISERIDSSSIDLIWLRDEYGIEFEGVNYASMDSSRVAPYNLRPGQISDICPVDPAKRDMLLGSVMRTLSTNATKNPTVVFRSALKNAR